MNEEEDYNELFDVLERVIEKINGMNILDFQEEGQEWEWEEGEEWEWEEGEEGENVWDEATECLLYCIDECMMENPHWIAEEGFEIDLLEQLWDFWLEIRDSIFDLHIFSSSVMLVLEREKQFINYVVELYFSFCMLK